MPARNQDDDWEPISRSDIQGRLDAEIAALSPGLLNTYREHATEIAELPCFRNEQYGNERIFVVARSGTRLLFFDDVEDEFAIGVADDDGVLRDWGLYGDLMDALRVF
jgi:hypothetical protein